MVNSGYSLRIHSCSLRAQSRDGLGVEKDEMEVFCWLGATGSTAVEFGKGF